MKTLCAIVAIAVLVGIGAVVAGTLMVDTNTSAVIGPPASTNGGFATGNGLATTGMLGTASNALAASIAAATNAAQAGLTVLSNRIDTITNEVLALQAATDTLNTATGSLQTQIDALTMGAGTNEPLWTAASNRVVYTNNASWTNWTANEAALVALPADVLKTLTNYVHVPSSSNWLDVDTAARGLRGCVTNQGGAGSADASGWSGYAATQTVDMAGQSMTNMQTLELAKITAMPSDGAASNLIILGGAPFGGYSGPGGNIILEGSLGNPALGHGGYGWVVFSNYWADLNDGEITNVAGISFADGTRQTTAAGSGTGDMLASTYDAAGGARQVAFADDFAAVSNWGDHAEAGYLTGAAASNGFVRQAQTSDWVTASHAGLATGMPVYAESDPGLTVWTNRLNGLAMNGWEYYADTSWADIAFPVTNGVPALFRNCTFTGTSADTFIVGNDGGTNRVVMVDCVLSNSIGGDLVLMYGPSNVLELIGCTIYSANGHTVLPGFTGTGSIYLRDCTLIWDVTNALSECVSHASRVLFDSCTFTNIGSDTNFTVCDAAGGVRKSVGFTGGYTFTEPLTRETGLDYVDIVNALMARVSTTGNGWGVTNLNGTNLVAGTVPSNALSAACWAAIGTAAGSGYATNAGAAGEGYYAMSNGAWAAFTPGTGSGISGAEATNIANVLIGASNLITSAHAGAIATNVNSHSAAYTVGAGSSNVLILYTTNLLISIQGTNLLLGL